MLSGKPLPKNECTTAIPLWQIFDFDVKRVWMERTFLKKIFRLFKEEL